MTRSNAFRPPWDAPQPQLAEPIASDARVPAERRWVEWLARRHPIVDVLREDRQRNDGISSPGFQAVASRVARKLGTAMGAGAVKALAATGQLKLLIKE